MVVALYLIAQMVGAGKLIQLLFGLIPCRRSAGWRADGALCPVRRHAGDYRVQIIKAVLLLCGASFMAFMVMKHVGFSFNNLFTEAMAVHPKGRRL